MKTCCESKDNKQLKNDMAKNREEQRKYRLKQLLDHPEHTGKVWHKIKQIQETILLKQKKEEEACFINQ